MEAITALREQLAYSHYLVEQCLEGLTAEQFHGLALGSAPTIAAVYVAGVVAEDRTVQETLQGRPPLAIAWSRTLELDPPPPGDGRVVVWTGAVRLDLAILRGYAQAVYTASDDYLGRLRAEDLECERHLGQGRVESLNWVLFASVIGPINGRASEIVAIRRAAGLGGNPTSLG